MDSEQLRSVILSNKSKGVRYIHKHLNVIRELLDSGENVSAIYRALKQSDSPPPISRSQFYRHLSKLSPDASSDSLVSRVATIEKPSSQADPRHDVLKSLSRSPVILHDSGKNPDDLI